ncbi:MAG: hypothetical protein JRI68_29860 [Deltaproteobacteria bacterium]|nr:hypothetical protein [Deltaproteobacteria bacterium]
MRRIRAACLLLAGLCAGCGAQGATESADPGDVETEGWVLGCWARPELKVEGDPARVAGWQTNLWLMDGQRSTDGRWAYSDPSTHRSLVGLAKAPGAFVELAHVGAHAELATTGSTLTVPGRPPLRQTTVRMYDSPVHEISHGVHIYRYHFPAPDLGWPHLDFRVPFADGAGTLQVRFTRDESRRPHADSPPFFGCDWPRALRPVHLPQN